MRFGYDGAPFYGWARQPGLRTVEGEIRDGLARCGVAPDGETAKLDVASRTDRGVSARANALALSSRLPGPRLLHALNGIAPEILFTAAREVPETFRPRAATYRRYHYHEVAPLGSLAAYRSVARLAERDVDVRSLGRGVPPGRPLRRTVTRCRVVRDPVGFRFEVQAPAFVWGMVRKLVASVRAVVSGDLARADLEDALAGRRRLTLPMAEPEPLVLWEVRYPGAWTVPAPRSAALEARYFLDAVAREQARARVLTSVASAARPPQRRTRRARTTARRRLHEP